MVVDLEDETGAARPVYEFQKVLLSGSKSGLKVRSGCSTSLVAGEVAPAVHDNAVGQNGIAGYLGIVCDISSIVQPV